MKVYGDDYYTVVARRESGEHERKGVVVVAQTATATRIAIKDMDRKAWLQTRRKFIGSSDAAAIAGLNPWRNKVAVWMDKTGQMPDEDIDNERMYWGRVLEDVVAKEFSLRNGWRVQRDNFIRIHPKFKFMGCNLDRVVFHPERGRGVLEIKTTNEWMRKEWDGDEVPDMYFIQVQHQLAVTGLPYAYMAVLIGGNKYKDYLVERDDEIIKYLTQIEAEFWLLVEGGVLPEMDGSTAATEVLKRMHPEAEEGKIVYLPDEAGDLLDRLDRAKEQQKIVKEARREAENQLKVLMGNAEEAHWGERKLRWSNVVSKRLDTKRLRAEAPDIYDKYAKETQSRRFMVR